MRIAVWHNLPSGGGQRALYDHINGLAKRGHQIEIWAPTDADRSMLDLGELAPYHPRTLRQRGKWLSRAVPALANQMLGFDIRGMDQHCGAVCDEINHGNFDVLLSGTCGQFAAPRIGRFATIPSVLYLQEPNRRLYEAPNIWALPPRSRSTSEMLRSGWSLFDVQRSRQRVREEICSAAAFDSILVNSRFSAESIARSYGLSARVCYLGVDPQLWKVEESLPNRSVVSIGTVAAHKRVLFIIEALAATSLPHPSLHWIANSWSESYLLEVKAEALRLGVDLQLHLGVPHESMLKILGQSSFLVYAPRLEPFGYAPLECAAAGLPTVAVAEGGVRESVVHNQTGLLVDDNVSKMAAAIDLLFDDADLLSRLGRSARQGVLQNWDIEGAVDRLERELELQSLDAIQK